MKKLVINSALLLVAALSLHGCFKSTVGYTYFNLAVYDQMESEDQFKPSTDIDTYAFWVDTTDWYIASWEDAVSRRITNKTTGEVLADPASIGEFNSSDRYQSSLFVNKPISMLVVVNNALQRYAYRKYELPENLSEVFAKLYMAAWRPTHTSSGWTVVNPFYTTAQPDDEGSEDNPVTE